MYRPVITTHPIPQQGDPGAFGAGRKYDIHTGIDLYCEALAEVRAIEDGVVVAVERFTGEHADSPWWNNTWAILVEGESGVIVYGEVSPEVDVGERITANQILGRVIPVLKRDKGVTPTTMLHLELLKHGTMKTGWWLHGETQPEMLLNPTELVRNLYD